MIFVKNNRQIKELDKKLRKNRNLIKFRCFFKENRKIPQIYAKNFAKTMDFYFNM